MFNIPHSYPNILWAGFKACSFRVLSGTWQERNTVETLYKFVVEPPPRHAACIVIVSRFLSAMCQYELF